MELAVESIECCIEEQAFSPSYDLAPSPPPSPISPVSKFLSLPVCLRSSLLKDDAEGVGGGSQIVRRSRKPGPPYIIKYSLVSSLPKKNTENFLQAV
jgi:hypothetical protein